MAPEVRNRVERAGKSLASRAGEFGGRLVNPAKVQKQAEEATRGGQFLAAFLLIAMVPLSFVLVTTANTMMVTFVLRGTDASENTPFVVTLVTFALLVMASWFWFQWVRTAGFGLANFRIGGGD